MRTMFGDPHRGKLPLASHKTLEFCDGAGETIVDCYTCIQQYPSVEAHVIAVNGPYGPFPEGESNGRE